MKKESYEYEEKELLKKRSAIAGKVSQIEKDIDRIHIKVLRETMPEKIDKLEKYFNTRFNKIVCFTYMDDSGDWAQMVLINEKERLIRIELDSSRYWQQDDLAKRGEDIKDDIADILREIWDSYPYKFMEYV